MFAPGGGTADPGWRKRETHLVFMKSPANEATQIPFKSVTGGLRGRVHVVLTVPLPAGNFVAGLRIRPPAAATPPHLQLESSGAQPGLQEVDTLKLLCTDEHRGALAH